MVPANMRALVGDIGGTKTALALAEVNPSTRAVQLSALRRYASASATGLDAIVEGWRAETGHMLGPEHAAFAVAGPIVEQRCQTTNLPWYVDARTLVAGGSQHVRLLNDLEAVAWSIGALDHDPSGGQLEVLYPGVERTEDTRQHSNNRCVIAAGTGLGEAGLCWGGHDHLPVANEGGHADFAPTNALEFALYEYLSARHGHVSWERVASGMGIANLYRFLLEHRGAEAPADTELEAAVDGHGDLPRAVSQAAHTKSDALAIEAMELFANFYGREAGNLALKYMACGGVYLGGGVTLANLEILRGPAFLSGFFAKGRMEGILRRMPVLAVLEPHAGLIGAARYAGSH